MSDLPILKTYKLFINGQFPRTESGRYLKLVNQQEELLANICAASRKDFRNAVVAAGNAQAGWAQRTAYNKSQILYRLAEMMQAKKGQLVSELQAVGSLDANQEIQEAINATVSLSGWCDKLQQVFSSVNPVASSHFNFSVYEPQGNLALLFDETNNFLEVVYYSLSALLGGNAITIYLPNPLSMVGISWAEVIQNSDMPAGVINILTGDFDELYPQFGSHMDVKAVGYFGQNQKVKAELQKAGANNLKRIITSENRISIADVHSPYVALSFMEVKTTWHPIEEIGSTGGGY